MLFYFWGQNGVFAKKYVNTSKVGYYAEYLGNVGRNIPKEVKHENNGLPDDRYPVFGYSLRNITAEEKSALLKETTQLMAYGTKLGGGIPTTDYNRMDKDGNLYMNDQTSAGIKKLYKHIGSKNMWYGEVSDDEPAIIKKLTIQARGIGNHITGLYAPAGEVIKVQMSAEDLATTGGLIFDIGQAFPVGKSNNIWAARNDFCRMPVILNTMSLNDKTGTLENGVYTAYIGSFLGGPIYVKPARANTKFSVTISGGVAYEHFILGYTTEEEFEQNRKSSAPYFDMEVWDRGVRVSGGKKYATKVNGSQLTYENLYDASIYWQKVMSVSTQVPTGSSSGTGIIFLYEPFVAAGGLVAFVGNNVVNAPPGYMSNALDYDAMVNRGYDGLWGNMHELNHHFQNGWGLPAAGEVSNNALSLVSYSLFTNISANRALGNAAEGSWAVGWDRYTNPSWSLRQTLSVSSANAGLDVYATLLHNFGQDMFIAAAQKRGGQNFNSYYRAWSEVTGNDMSYFFNEVLHSGINAAPNGNPMFVPVASIYQTGRSITASVDGKQEKSYIKTARPYSIKAGEDFVIDLRQYLSNDDGTHKSGTIVLPSGFSYKIKNISNPQHGKIEKYKVENKEIGNMYLYRPDKNHTESGEIRVTLEITKDDGKFKVDDVDLVLEFNQDHEMNKTILQRTIYTYSADTLYATAEEAYENQYAGYTEKIEMDNRNPTQNSNLEIWVPNGATTGLPEGTKSVMEVFGKIRVPQAGKYRIALRGRHSAALYVSLDEGKTYTLAAKRNHNTNANGFDMKDETTYRDFEFTSSAWVYIKAVLRVDYDSAFIGVGWGEFVAPMFTTQEDEEGNIHYYDGNGKEVTEDEVNNAQSTVKVGYVSGYRASYEIKDNKFVTPDYYPKKYKVTYDEDYKEVQSKATVVNSSACKKGFEIENGVDLDSTTRIESAKLVTDETFEMTVDIGDEILTNTFAFVSCRVGQWDYVPTSFKLYVGTKSADMTDMHLIGEYTDLTLANGKVAIRFDSQKVRYYKAVITDMNRHRYVSFSDAKFSYSIEGVGEHYSPDDDAAKYSGKWSVENKFCNFGHLYSGGNGATMEFEFTGTHFAIYSFVSQNGGKLEISIDGQSVGTADLKGDYNGSKIVFVSSELSKGKHRVSVRCSGQGNIDSFAIWKGVETTKS